MTGLHLLLLAALLALGFAPRAEAAAVPEVKARLVTDAAAVEAGKPFRVGVLLEIPRGWHIYWKNPGDSGTPTTVAIEAEGFSVGPVELPAPERWVRAGVVGYGYEGSVLAVARLTPKEPSIKKSVTAAVSWLSCSADQCVPGEASLSIVVGEATPDEALFDAWADRFPVPARGVAVEALAAGERSGKVEVALELPAGAPAEAKDLEVLPAPGDALEVKDFTWKASKGRVEIAFQAALRDGARLEREEVELVLGWGKGDRRRGVRVIVPLRRG